MKLTNRYAMETLHLNACLKLFWSDRYKEFYMKTCLINPSGRCGGFMPDDYFGEWVVRESQDHIPYNYTAATDEYIRRTISPQLMVFRAARKHMTAETGALTYGAHSSIVSRTTDIEVVCDNDNDGDNDNDSGGGGGGGDGPSAHGNDDESQDESDFDEIELEDFDIE